MKEIFRFRSTDDIHDLYTVKWIPEQSPKAVLQITHGMVEYMDRYDEFARFMNDNDILVVGFDLLGHGRSAKKEDQGYFAEEDPGIVLIEDMHKLRLLMEETYPGIPYFMMGHSMGSYLLRAYITVYSQGLAGAIIIGTGFNSPSLATFGINLTKVLSKVKGGHTNSGLVEALVFGRNVYSRFDVTGKDPEKSWLSRDIEQVNRYYHDDLCRFKFTINGYYGLFQGVRIACSRSEAEKISRDLPVLIASGSDDPIGDLGKGVEKAYRLYKNAGMTDVTMTLYEGARHEILNELNRDEVYNDIKKWLLSRI